MRRSRPACDRPRTALSVSRRRRIWVMGGTCSEYLQSIRSREQTSSPSLAAGPNSRPLTYVVSSPVDHWPPELHARPGSSNASCDETGRWPPGALGTYAARIVPHRPPGIRSAIKDSPRYHLFGPQPWRLGPFGLTWRIVVRQWSSLRVSTASRTVILLFACENVACSHMPLGTASG